MRITEGDRDRFWAKVAIRSGPNSCWPWTAHLSRDGYGRIGIGGEIVDAHVAGYRIQKGPIPKGKVVRHTCDNRACVRGDHLVLGSHQQNSADKVARGRHACGVTHPQTIFDKATVKRVKRLRDQGRSFTRISELTGISRSHAHEIVKGTARGPCKPGEKS